MEIGRIKLSVIKSILTISKLLLNLFLEKNETMLKVFFSFKYRKRQLFAICHKIFSRINIGENERYLVLVCILFTYAYSIKVQRIYVGKTLANNY